MDFALVVEGHPDNVAASMFGGFTAGYMNGALEDSPIDGDNKNDCSMDNMQNGTNGTRASADEELNIPGQDLGVYIPIPWPKAIKAVLVIPTFELATKLARSVLPPTLYPCRCCVQPSKTGCLNNKHYSLFKNDVTKDNLRSHEG